MYIKFYDFRMCIWRKRWCYDNFVNLKFEKIDIIIYNISYSGDEVVESFLTMFWQLCDEVLLN